MRWGGQKVTSIFTTEWDTLDSLCPCAQDVLQVAPWPSREYPVDPWGAGAMEGEGGSPEPAEVLLARPHWEVASYWYRLQSQEGAHWGPGGKVSATNWNASKAIPSAHLWFFLKCGINAMNAKNLSHHKYWLLGFYYNKICLAHFIDFLHSENSIWNMLPK